MTSMKLCAFVVFTFVLFSFANAKESCYLYERVLGGEDVYVDEVKGDTCICEIGQLYHCMKCDCKDDGGDGLVLGLALGIPTAVFLILVLIVAIVRYYYYSNIEDENENANLGSNIL